jgi:hypothetical protein
LSPKGATVFHFPKRRFTRQPRFCHFGATLGDLFI